MGSMVRHTPQLKRLQNSGNLSSIDKAQFEVSFRDIANRLPITKRVNSAQIELLLQRELENQHINIDFEYAVQSNGMATKLRSKNFKLNPNVRYAMPLFQSNEGKTNYELIVDFPHKRKYLLSSIIGMATLSIIFTLIIIVAYSSALYQLMRQKQISEIKTDFINNMTHEFKTPIATINLALDAIKNPKILDDTEKVKRYLQMIRDENKRMHAQVENVLRISKLEKNQLDISKEPLDAHELIEDAINHVQLLIEDRGGYIRTHFQAENADILANDVHFTNVLVNILDNAIKYSPNSPEIDVFTEVVKTILSSKFRIREQG